MKKVNEFNFKKEYLYIVLAIIAAVLIYKLFKKPTVKPDDAPIVPGAPDVTLSPNDAAAIAQRAHDAFYCWFCPNARCAALEELESLSANDLIYVANTYKNSFDNSIKEDVKSLNYHCLGSLADQPRRDLLEKFETLNIL